MNCDTHVKSIMHDWKGNIERFGEGKEGHIKTTLSNTYGFNFTISQSIGGYFHILVFVDCATGYRWIYEMKTKD